MDFVDGDGRFEPVFLRAVRDPIGIGPFMGIETGDDGAGIGAEFRAEGEGIGFEWQNVAARTDDFIFVDGAFCELGDENFPETGGAASAHGMDAAVPSIEVAHDADAPCAGSPNGEMNAADAFECDHVGAEFFVSVVVAALAHQIQIELAENNGKGVGIEDFEGLAEVRASLNLVAARGGRSGLVRRPSSFEETFAGGRVAPSMAGGRKEMEASAAQGRKKRTVQLPSEGCGPMRAKGSAWRAARKASIWGSRRGSREAIGAERFMDGRCSAKLTVSET